MDKTRPDLTTISCRQEALEAVKARKRGGETYDDLFRRMAAQYEPEPKN